MFRDGGFWYYDTAEIRSGLQLIVMSENAVHGEDTHWIEGREVPDA